MKINFNNNRILQAKQSKKENKVNSGVSFAGNDKHIIKKRIIPLSLAVMAGIGLLKSCDKNINKTTTDVEGVKIVTINTDNKSNDAIIETLNNFKNNIGSNSEFLDNIEIQIVDKYKHLDDSNSFNIYLKNKSGLENEKGRSFYSDGKIKSYVVIQEKAHNGVDKILTYTEDGVLSIIPSLKHSFMHEIGHQFDQYFGHDHNSDTALSWDAILLEKEQSEDENPYSFAPSDAENEIRDKYYASSSLSDKDDFIKALVKDYENIKQIKETNPKDLICNFSYYTQGIDFSADEITYDMVKNLDYTRSEVYANLFAYLTGESDGDKKDFFYNFPNSLKVVKNDIESILNYKVSLD